MMLWQGRTGSSLVKLMACKSLLQAMMTALTHWGRDKMAAIFRTTFLNAFSWMKMLKFRLRNHWNLFLINNIPAMVQIMAWRPSGDKPLSEPMVVSLLTHICVTRPQWDNETLDCMKNFSIISLIARFMRPTWAPWTLLSGIGLLDGPLAHGLLIWAELCIDESVN